MMRRFLILFFHHLYHGLAWSYDLVACVVSQGHWNDWIRAALPYITGTRVLELGHGPGHLQRLLQDLGRVATGVDESPQMARLARRRLVQHGQFRGRLARAMAQSLPFRAAVFDTVLATFPSPYIVDPRTLSEVSRVLQSDGRLVVVPAAWPHSKLIGWLYRFTGNNSARVEPEITDTWTRPFAQAGFATEVKIIEVESGRLLVVVAIKR